SLVRTGRSAGCFRVVDGGACGSPGGIVADARAAVTDTHPLLFHAAGGRRLGRHAARVFAAAEARTALIGGVAEEIGEELTEGSPEVDAPTRERRLVSHITAVGT